MNRREFSQWMAGALLMPGWAQAAPMVKGVRFSFMLWALERQAPFDRCMATVSSAGYQGIELVGGVSEVGS